MALTPKVADLSVETIALTKKLLRYVERLDTSQRELPPDRLVELTRVIGEHAHRVHMLSSSIRITTKQTMRRRRLNAARKPSGFQWPVIAETASSVSYMQEGGR